MREQRRHFQWSRGRCLALSGARPRRTNGRSREQRRDSEQPADGPRMAATLDKQDRAAIAGPTRSQEPYARTGNTTDRH
jgi:hypothetical protein